MFKFIRNAISFAKALFTKPKKQSVVTEKVITEPIPTNVIEKILFQPNTILVDNSLEYPISNKQPNPIENSIEQGASSPPPLPTQKAILRLECNSQTLAHIDNLCQYFEISDAEAIARGLWLLTLIRDVEILNKKVGVITTDHNGLVTDLTPINVV